MNLLLQNPYLLGLAPLIAVPVLVHLLTRARPPQYPFSATAFVLKVVQQTIRINRPKDRLLLLCRTLLFAMLCAAFLRPVAFLDDRLTATHLPQSVVVVIDRSASMTWSEGGRTRFANACDEAAAVLARLSSRDTANIVWIDREPDAVFPELGTNIDYLLDVLKQATGTNEYGYAENAIQLALSQLEPSAGEKELCIISDFQASQWKHITVEVPEDVTVSTLTPARETAYNGAVLSISTDPVAPLAGDTALVMLSVGNFSNTPRNRTVIVKMGDHIVTRHLQIPAWGHGAVALEHVFPQPGMVTVSARLDEDSFGEDDWQGIMVPVRHAWRVGITGDDPRTAPVFRKALRALPWVEMTEIDVQAVKAAQELDVIVLAGWQGENVDTLIKLQQQGLALVVSPAPDLPLDAVTRLLGRPASQAVTDVFQLQSLDETMGLAVGDESHKAFTVFRDGQFGDPSQAAFSKRLAALHLPDQGQPLLTFRDNRPAVVAYAASPPVVLWLAPLSPECSNWPAQPAFLPFFGELMGTISRRRQIALPGTALTGETLSFERTAFNDAQQLYDEAGQTYPVIRIDSAAKGSRIVTEPMRAPGVYRLCTRQDCTPSQIVNFPGTESDLRTGPPPDIAKGPVFTAHTAEALKARREGISLWAFLVWAALGLIGLEGLLVVLLDRTETKITQGSL